MIWNAKKPVMTIKPFAAGQLRPFQGLTFVWTTLRRSTWSLLASYALRAEEGIELSLSILEHRLPCIELQESRSKASLK